MADTSGVAKASDEAELTEDDIPGTALADPLESHTVPALKWWLLCHGIKIRIRSAGYITSTKVPTAYTHVRLDSIFLHMKYSYP